MQLVPRDFKETMRKITLLIYEPPNTWQMSNGVKEEEEAMPKTLPQNLHRTRDTDGHGLCCAVERVIAITVSKLF